MGTRDRVRSGTRDRVRAGTRDPPAIYCKPWGTQRQPDGVAMAPLLGNPGEQGWAGCGHSPRQLAEAVPSRTRVRSRQSGVVGLGALAQSGDAGPQSTSATLGPLRCLQCSSATPSVTPYSPHPPCYPPPPHASLSLCHSQCHPVSLIPILLFCLIMSPAVPHPSPVPLCAPSFCPCCSPAQASSLPGALHVPWARCATLSLP